MNVMPGVKLCLDCRFKRPVRDEGDKTPCGRHEGASASQARALCRGDDFEERPFWTERRLAKARHMEIALSDLPARKSGAPK